MGTESRSTQLAADRVTSSELLEALKIMSGFGASLWQRCLGTGKPCKDPQTVAIKEVSYHLRVRSI